MLSLTCTSSYRYCNKSSIALLNQIVGVSRRGKSDKSDNKPTSKAIKCGDCDFMTDRQTTDLNPSENVRIESWPKPAPSTFHWKYTCPTEPQPYNYDMYKIKTPNVVVPPLPPHAAKPSIECKVKSPCQPALFPDPCPSPPKKPFPWMYVFYTIATMYFLQVVYKTILWLESLSKGASIVRWRPRPVVKRPPYEDDLPPCVQYLIVGGGPAGVSAYRAIMDNDPEAKVFFITSEDICPYKRWALAKFMWLNKDPPDMKNPKFFIENDIQSLYELKCPEFMDPREFYDLEKGPAVSIGSGWCVKRVDADKHKVLIKTETGDRPMYYQRCLLAPGARPRNLEVFKSAPKKIRKKITTFCNIRDLESSFRAVLEAQHVTIIGAGPLGCELAFHIGARKRVIERDPDDRRPPLEVAQVYKDQGVLGGLIPAYLGEWLGEKIHCQGVTMLNNREVYDVSMTEDNRLELVMSDGSKLITDFVFVAIGNEPRDDLAEESDLELDVQNGGFLVNAELEARKHLYIAGDAASVYSQIHNCRYRFENHANAMQSGYLAGMNMTGYWLPCNSIREINFSLGKDMRVQSYGNVGGSLQTIALFKNCLDDEDARRYDVYTAKDNVVPCYKDSAEYKHRYKKGIIFYMQKETIVGIMFWNVPPFEDRKEVVYEILLAKPTFRDINVIAELLKFPDVECAMAIPEEIAEPKMCWKGLLKEW